MQYQISGEQLDGYMKSIMKKCFLLAIVLGIVILLIKNWQVDSADQICQTDYTRMNYKDGYYYYQSSADHFYLYKSDGKRSECLAKQVPQEIYLNNNWIYFTNASDGQTLYKICTDGSGMKQVLDQKIDRFILLEDKVYYISGVDGYLYSWQEEAGSKLLYQGNCSWVNTDGKLLYVREQKTLENKDSAIVTMDKYGNILSCFDIDGYNMIPTDQVLYYLKDNYIVCAMPENGERIGNIEIPVKTVTESVLDFGIWEDNIYVLSYEPEEAYAIYQYEISSCTWNTLCVQKLENSSWDYRGFHDFHIKNGKIFIKEWIAEGKGELWQQIDIKSGSKEMFEDMEYPCNVKVSDGYMLTGVAACSEAYLAEDYTYNKDEEDGEGNLIKTNIVLPQLNERIKAYREINSKIKQEAEDFYRERIEFAEYIKDAAVEWENESYGNWGYTYVYADASYVSIVYWKFIGRNGLNDIKDDHYEVRVYSSETGEELSVEDLIDVSRDEVLLKFSYAIRKTDEGLRMFWDDLDCLDSDYRKIYYLLTEEGVVIRIVESMRTKVTDFTIGYDEISLFKN